MSEEQQPKPAREPVPEAGAPAAEGQEAPADADSVGALPTDGSEEVTATGFWEEPVQPLRKSFAGLRANESESGDQGQSQKKQ